MWKKDYPESLIFQLNLMERRKCWRCRALGDNGLSYNICKCIWDFPHDGTGDQSKAMAARITLKKQLGVRICLSLELRKFNTLWFVHLDVLDNVVVGCQMMLLCCCCSAGSEVLHNVAPHGNIRAGLGGGARQGNRAALLQQFLQHKMSKRFEVVFYNA